MNDATAGPGRVGRRGVNIKERRIESGKGVFHVDFKRPAAFHGHEPALAANEDIFDRHLRHRPVRRAGSAHYHFAARIGEAHGREVFTVFHRDDRVADFELPAAGQDGHRRGAIDRQPEV